MRSHSHTILAINTSTPFVKTRDDGRFVFSGERALNGSRNPIEVEAHWDWRNPLNVLPLGIVLLVVAALVSLIV